MTTPVVTPARAAAPSASWGAGGVPWFVWAAVVAATSAKVGILWDISWHRSIGRDTFWTPAHMAIYLGGVLAGLSCGWVVLKTTLMGTPDERAAAVTFWGFRGPLGAWVCIWGAFPLLLVAVARAVRLPWPATTAAALYIAFSLLTIWILQLAPATPKLAPVFNPVTHMVPPPFPLLLVVPAAAIDLLLRRAGRNREWILSVATGLAFLAVFSVVQWFFTEFLLTPHARNFFFGGDQWDYSSRLGPWRYEFWRIGSDPVTAGGLAIAAALAIVSARLGLWWGNWMQRLQR